MAEAALQGVRVLDLSEGIAGPVCSRLLGSYGAEVIKVEKPGTGDVTRKAGPFPNDVPHPEKSALFLNLNIDKKGVTLSLEKESGRKILKEMAKRADILVEGFQPGQMADWGLAYESLEKVNPRLIVTSITPFGQTGPYRHYKSSSAVLDALSGHTYSQGVPRGEPLRYAEGTAEYNAGIQAAIAIMGAVLYTQDSGEGQYIDFSIFESMPDMDYWRTAAWTHAHELRPRTNGRYGIPGKAYRCRDGYVTIAGTGPSRTLIPLASVTGILELMEPDALELIQTPEGAEKLEAIIEPWLLSHDKYEIFNALQQARMQAGVVTSPEDLLNDPGFEARGFWVEADHPVVGRLKYPGLIAHLEEMEWQVKRGAPLLGQHNEEIYCGELGYPPEKLTQLTQNGVI